MPYLQPATDNPFGFMPAEDLDRQRIISRPKASSATVLFAGDPVILSAGAVTLAQTTSSGVNMGVCAGPSAAGETHVLVYEGPDNLFTAQDDGDTSALTATAIGKNFAMLMTTGSVLLNRSQVEIDANTGGTTSTDKGVRIVDLHPIEKGVFASGTGQPRLWICKFITHQMTTVTGV